jgi:hypothetical protein
MRRRGLYFILSGATVFATMSYLIQVFIALFANFSLAVS